MCKTMLSDFVKCKKGLRILKIIKTRNRRKIFLSKYGVCDSIKITFIKEHEEKKLFSTNSKILCKIQCMLLI